MGAEEVAVAREWGRIDFGKGLLAGQQVSDMHQL